MGIKRSQNKIAGLDEETLAIGLGWFSIGLGFAELAAPKRTARLMGMKNRPALMRVFGLREMTTGIGILTRKQPKNWLWARVIGDALDLAILSSSVVTGNGSRGRATLATAAVAGVTALDVLCSQRMTERLDVNISRIHVKRAITINGSPEELYRRWRDFENLPRLMNHLKSVRVIDEKRSHWVAKAPAGRTVEWDAEIVSDVPGEVIAWQSVADADVRHGGSVRFERAPGNRGTYLIVQLECDPPAGVLGSLVAKMFGEHPAKQIAVDLMRFKQQVETGEVARTEGQSAGRKHSTSRKCDDFVRV
jgi:uncharacterized membrane protein